MADSETPKLLPNRDSGAVRYEDCPTGGGPRHCKCGYCAICGQRKHTAIHGPVDDGGTGSKPFDHEFKEK